MKTGRFFSRWFAGALVLFAGAIAWSANVVAADATAPVVSFSLLSVADRTVEQGEPFVVKVRLSTPAGSKAPITIAPAAGDWTSALLIEIAKDKQAAPLARAHVVGHLASPTITIEPGRSAGGLWQFSTEAMNAFAPGDYVVRVRLKTTDGSANADKTIDVFAPLMTLKVVATTSEAVRVAQRTLGRAQEAMLADRNEDAAKLIDGLLAKTPKHREALILRAALAEKAGNFAAALFCTRLASNGIASGSPPPADLYDLQTRLQAKLLSGGASGSTAAALPAWSWPPRELYVDIEKATPASAASPRR